MTMRGASKPWAAAIPAAKSPFRSQSRSFRPPGIWSGRRRPCRRRRRRLQSTSRPCRSITPADRSSAPTARTASPNISSSTASGCGTRNMRWPDAIAWPAASRRPPVLALRQTPLRRGRNMCRRGAAAACRRPTGCRETSRSCSAYDRKSSHKSATVVWEFRLEHVR